MHVAAGHRDGLGLGFVKQGPLECLGEVHGPQSVVVDLHGFGQSLGVPAVALS